MSDIQGPPSVFTGPSLFLGFAYVFKELRKLPKTSDYPGFSIYKQVKVNIATKVETDYGTDEWWKPIPGDVYRVYNDGDDIVEVPRTTPEKPTVTGPLNVQSPLSHPPGTRLTYAGKQYIATTRRARWENIIPPLTYGELSGVVSGKPAIGLSSSGQKIPMRTGGIRMTENPYSYNEIELWILSPAESGYSFTNNNGSTVIAYFWYHPTQKKFYAVHNTESIFAKGSPASDGTIGRSYITYVTALLGDAARTNATTLGQLAIGLIPPNSPALRKSIEKALITYMIDNKLLTPEAALAALNTVDKGESIITKIVGNKQGRAGGQTTTRKQKTNNVTKKPNGTTQASLAPKSSVPQMVQYYNVDGLNEPVDNKYPFLFPPSQINYTGIGSEWMPVERSGSTPLVDWKGFKLLQVSFQFLIAPDKQGTFEDIQGESVISLDVEDQIAKLRKMAAAPYPVTLLGFDSMMSEQVGFPYLSGRGVDFVITEMNISSLYRTTEGKINRAQCDITLQEIHNDAVPLITFPKLKIPGVKLPPKDKPTKENEGPTLDSTSNQTAGFGE